MHLAVACFTCFAGGVGEVTAARWTEPSHETAACCDSCSCHAIAYEQLRLTGRKMTETQALSILPVQAL
jgi:hypothetical protein